MWDDFVRENWAPALEIDFGLDWREKFSEEVIAILWWAVKNRNRFPGAPPSIQGSEEVPGGIAGSLPPMAGFPHAISLGMVNPMVQGMPEQQGTSSPLVFGSFRSGPVGEGSSSIQVHRVKIVCFTVSTVSSSASRWTWK